MMHAVTLTFDISRDWLQSTVGDCRSAAFALANASFVDELVIHIMQSHVPAHRIQNEPTRSESQSQKSESVD